MAIVNITRLYNTGDNLTASYYNQDRQEIVAGVNSISDSQISASAGIQESKLLFNDASGHSHAGGGSGKKVLVTDLNPTALTATYLLRVNAGGTAIEAVSPPSAVTMYRAFGFYISTTPLVTGTDLSWEATVPQNMTCIKLWGSVKTAPSGSSIDAVIKIKGGATVATLSIPNGNTSASTVSFTTPTLVAGMILQADITQVGSGTPGDALSMVLEATQP
jgi:hypothetical protein